jgi:hypothetical protein
VALGHLANDSPVLFFSLILLPAKSIDVILKSLNFACRRL